MNLLAIETSTDLGSIAIWRDGELLRRDCPAGRSHSETLLPLIRSTLHEAGLGFSDLGGIAFAAGPGSFTGLRVACGVAQGLAFAHALPIIPVGTLEAMALASAGEKVIILLDARMGEVYHGRFADSVPFGEVAVCPPSALPLPDSGDWLACGNGLAAYPVLRQRGIALSIDGANTVNIPRRTAGTAGGGWVAEGSPIRVGKLTTAAASLTPKKMGVARPQRS
jgi:tRNA threonylcarbamoyladenosine biosynthesis protein TsaB